MKTDTKESALKRLARIEGQVRGVSKMISEDRYCIDVVRQVQAVLDDHLETCVENALTSEDVDTRREKVEELVAVLGGRKK